MNNVSEKSCDVCGTTDNVIQDEFLNNVCPTCKKRLDEEVNETHLERCEICGKLENKVKELIKNKQNYIVCKKCNEELKK